MAFSTVNNNSVSMIVIISPIVELIGEIENETTAQTEARKAATEAYKCQVNYFASSIGYVGTDYFVHAQTALQAADTTAPRILAVASAIVEDYAPLAPDAVRTEAVIRLGGYLFETPHGNVVLRSFDELADGESGGATLGNSNRFTAMPKTTQYAAMARSAFNHSGAKSLVSRWVQRRAVVV